MEGNGFSKKEYTFECFEIHDIIKCYQSIRNIVQTAEEGEDQIRYAKSQSFAGPSMFQKLKGSLSPVKQ